MKSLKLILILAGTLFISHVFAQSDQHIKLSNQHPANGEHITVIYDPTGTVLQGKKDFTASVYYMNYKTYQAEPLRLKKDGKLLKGQITIQNTAKAFFINISPGDEVNNSKVYLYLVYKGDQPVQGAYASEAYFISSGSGTHYAKIQTDLNDGVELYKKEFLLYPQGSSEYQKDYLALWPKLSGAQLRATAIAEHIDTQAGNHYESMNKLKDDLAKAMIKRHAPEFALKDMDGKTVSLADMKGKVVILDFWATWCFPCKASFPGMQLAVKKYKNDPNVKFLFIDVWEQGDYYVDDVKKFINDNHYDFHVLLDEKQSNSKVTKVEFLYDVAAIPTKFVIDKAGDIRFKYVGNLSNPAKVLDEVSTMIELANHPLTEPVRLNGVK